MKTLQRMAHQMALMAETVQNSKHVYAIDAMESPQPFYDLADTWARKPYEPLNDIEAIACAAFRHLSGMKKLGYTPRSMRNIIFSRILGELGYIVFFARKDNTIHIYDAVQDFDALKNAVDGIHRLFLQEFACVPQVTVAGPDAAAELVQRVRDVTEYYIEKHGAWITDFIPRLGDDISRFSFRHFLKERFQAHVLWDAPAMYPITPPPQTQSWRKGRIDTPPALPHLAGCTDDLRDFFYLHSFIYEQYGIEGVVEAQPGHCVIDAGAYIGDTALYFSKKVGTTGKVFGFEAIQQSVDAANKNIRLNACDNVKMLCLALSDATKELRFNATEVALSGSHASVQGDVVVQAVTLDDFATQHGLHIDYIKADVEGAEMDVLRGAQNCIREHKPICGIALYHRQDDFHEIPKYLASLCPEYTFYFRCEAEPVLFAIVK